MKSILMTAVAATVILLSGCNEDLTTNLDEVKVPSEELSFRNGVITQDVSILRVITNNPVEVIDSVELKVSGSVHTTFYGCNDDDCTYDLTGIASNTYDVVAYTNLGRFFGTATIN